MTETDRNGCRNCEIRSLQVFRRTEVAETFRDGSFCSAGQLDGGDESHVDLLPDR